MSNILLESSLSTQKVSPLPKSHTLKFQPPSPNNKYQIEFTGAFNKLMKESCCHTVLPKTSQIQTKPQTNLFWGLL